MPALDRDLEAASGVREAQRRGRGARVDEHRAGRRADRGAVDLERLGRGHLGDRRIELPSQHPQRARLFAEIDLGGVRLGREAFEELFDCGHGEASRHVHPGGRGLGEQASSTVGHGDSSSTPPASVR